MSSTMAAACCRYVCVVQKAYQERDSVISTVTTKVKGFAFTNISDMQPRFWDVVDYNIPSQVSGMFRALPEVLLPNDCD